MTQNRTALEQAQKRQQEHVNARMKTRYEQILEEQGSEAFTLTVVREARYGSRRSMTLDERFFIKQIAEDLTLNTYHSKRENARRDITFRVIADPRLGKISIPESGRIRLIFEGHKDRKARFKTRDGALAKFSARSAEVGVASSVYDDLGGIDRYFFMPCLMRLWQSEPNAPKFPVNFLEVGKRGSCFLI